jgi:hypothetical protein
MLPVYLNYAFTSDSKGRNAERSQFLPDELSNILGLT